MNFDDYCGYLLAQNVLNVWLYCTQGPGLCVTTLAAKEQSGFLLPFFHPEIAYLNGADHKTFISISVFSQLLPCYSSCNGCIYSIKGSQRVKKHLYSLLSLSCNHKMVCVARDLQGNSYPLP